jgi:hypothetical protein
MMLTKFTQRKYRTVYVREKKKAEDKKTAADVIKKGNFLLKFIEKAETDITAGSLESSMFQGSMETISMGQLRTHITTM